MTYWDILVKKQITKKASKKPQLEEVFVKAAQDMYECTEQEAQELYKSLKNNAS